MDGYNPISVTPIEHAGPIIEVSIKRVGSPLAGLTARGLIDTGASDILISPAIAQKLNLTHVNDDIMDVVGGGTLDSQMYSGFIEVPTLGFAKIVPLYAVPWKQTSHTILLGREFLRYFMFYYDGPKGMFHFSKPFDWAHEALEHGDG